MREHWARFAVRQRISPVFAVFLVLLFTVACQHAGYGGHVFGEVPLGAPVEDYLRSVWDDFESLDAAERSRQVRVIQDSDGMRSVKVPAAEVGVGAEVAGVLPSELTMSLHDGRIISAGWFYQGENTEHTVAIALELYHRACRETGREPDHLHSLMYAWPVDKRTYMLGVELDLKQVVWAIASQKMIGEAVAASEE